MSKEELNNGTLNSQVENSPDVHNQNTQQNTESTLIKDDEEINQSQIRTESLDENRDSNFLSGDLDNVNKCDENSSDNEKSALNIEESANLDSTDDKSHSHCETDLTDSVQNTSATVKCDENDSNSGILISRSQSQEAQSKTDIEDKVDENLADASSRITQEVISEEKKVDDSSDRNTDDTKRTSFTLDSGAHFSKSENLHDPEKSEGNGKEESFDANISSSSVTDTQESNHANNLDSESVENQIVSDSKNNEDIVNEEEKDTSKSSEEKENKDVVNKIEIAETSHAESHENEGNETKTEVIEDNPENNQSDKVEAEAYEDDFEETTEENKNNSKNDNDNFEKKTEQKDIESSEKIKDSVKEIEDNEVTCKGDNITPANSKEVRENTISSNNVTDQNTFGESNKSETKEEENTEGKVSVSEKESKNTDDYTNSDKNKSDVNVSQAVDANNLEQELNEIIIDEDGIPKVAITTVPDRPPSSQNGDTVDQSDPFEDFGFDTDVNDKNDKKRSDLKENGGKGQVKSNEKEVQEEVKMPGKSEIDNAHKSELNAPDEDHGSNIEQASKGDSSKTETIADSKNDITNKVVSNSKGDENIAGSENQTAEVARTEEKSKSVESPPASQQESPLEQLLKRNVQIDGTVDSLPKLESTVTTLLISMKDVMKYYSDLLKLQALKDFTNDLGKFRGDFLSITEAFKSCNSMTSNLNQHLKELRLITDEVRSQINRKFQQEDLKTWVDVPIEKEKEKEKLNEEIYAAEKAAMANAAEARQIVAKAAIGVSEANKLIAEMEAQATDAQAIAQKAEMQARVALMAAEEAKVAAEERRRAEEEAKARAEERAKIKAAEDEKRKAMEEMKIYQEAAAKGTSVEDERKRFKEEKARKEQERKNPKNWPRFTFETKGVDFKPAAGCIIRAIEGSMRKTDVTCSYVDQSEGILTLEPTEELVSNIIRVTQTEEDIHLSFEEPLSVALPISISRVPTGKETVMKQRMSNGAWRELPSADVQFEDFRELKFVEGRCSKLGAYVVVLRPKKDMLQFLKKGCKLLCSSDFRISLSCKPGAFKQNMNAVLEVQTYDSSVIQDLKMRFPKECEDLLTASPFVKFSIPVKNLEKPLTVTLPLPQTQTRQKRPATGITRETKPTQDIRPSTARPATTNEDDAQEQIFFLHRDDKSGWAVNSKINLVQPKSKDTVIFDIPTPYERMLLIRTKAGKREAAVEKMATILESMATQRNVKFIVRQRNDDVADVMVACAISKRADRTLKYMEDNAFTEGPNPSPDIILKEGQQLFVKFRGNVECISKNPSLSFIYNTNIRATREFKINEKEEFAQKSLPSYRGFVQIFTKAFVPSPQPEGAAKNVQPEMVEAEVLLAELLVELPKPEAEPPKPLTTAPLHLKEGPLTNGVLRLIAGMMGKEWKEVGAQLNLKPMRIQAILRNHLNKNTAETRFDMLVTWAKRVPKSVDKVQILCNALNACGRADIAEEVRQKGQQYKQQRFMSARVSHLRQAFVKVAKTTAVFNHWKNFAKDLGVSEDKIKQIDESGGSGQEKCYTSLETWKDDVGETATVTSLATFLKSAKQERLSRDLESMVAT